MILHSKTGKDIPKDKASANTKDAQTTRGLFYFTEKAKHRFIANKIMTSGVDKMKDNKSSGLTTRFVQVQILLRSPT